QLRTDTLLHGVAATTRTAIPAAIGAADHRRGTGLRLFIAATLQQKLSRFLRLLPQHGTAPPTPGRRCGTHRPEIAAARAGAPRQRLYQPITRAARPNTMPAAASIRDQPSGSDNTRTPSSVAIRILTSRAGAIWLSGVN